VVDEEQRSPAGGLERATGAHAGHHEISGTFSIDDLIVFVTSECFAVPLNIAAGEAFIGGHLKGAALGWGIGVPLAVLGFTFHWWKRWIPMATRNTIQWGAKFGWPIAFIAAMVYLAPFVYQRATPPPGPGESVSAPQTENGHKALPTLPDQQKRLDDALSLTDPQLPAALQRVVTSKTPEQLWFEFCQGFAPSFQCDLPGEKGKWISVDGRMMQFRPPAYLLVVVGEKSRGVQCILESRWRSKLSTLRQGDLIKLTGRIVTFQNGILTLESCDLS